MTAVRAYGFHLIIIVCVLSSRILFAALANVTNEELIDMLRLQENRIQAFQMKYTLAQTPIDTTSQSTPPVSSIVIDCEFSQDYGKGSKFFHEKWASGETEKQYAYDGKVGTELRLKHPGQRQVAGTIMPVTPKAFSDESIWKPELTTYGLIPDHTLSSALANSRRMQVTVENIDGKDLYKVVFEVKTGTKRVEAQGGTRVVDTTNTYAALLLPEKNLRPLKVARLLSYTDPGLLYECEASDFREVSPGVWCPFTLVRTNPQSNLVKTIEVTEIALNERASVIQRLTFPPLTHVTDEIAMIKYRIGLSDTDIEAGIRDATAMASSENGGRPAIPDDNKRDGETPGEPVIPTDEKGEQSDRVLMKSAPGSYATYVVAAALVACGAYGVLRFNRRRVRQEEAARQ